jgi:RNA polymerase sigma-70 factor (ECF subfamily)
MWPGREAASSLDQRAASRQPVEPLRVGDARARALHTGSGRCENAPVPPTTEATVVEDRLRTLAAEGKYEVSFEQALDAYGDELLHFLAAMVPDEDAAREVYSELCEQLWKAFPAFEWRASFRTWAYVAARNAVHAHRTRSARAQRFRSLTTGVVAATPEPQRTRTAPHLRTENKSKLAELRELLEPDDRMILALRIDRGLEWTEVAEVMSGHTFASDAERTRAAAATRKRFERIKERLRELAAEQGLLDRES